MKGEKLMRNQQTMFEKMLDAMSNTGDIMLRYYFQTEMFKNSIFERQEREKMKEEIIQEVLARISIRLEDEAIKQLDEMLRNLGK